MRVTKKYAGASCLGRRVHHFRDHIQPTVSEIQLAKQELDHLEQRFRMRIERGHASPPMMPSALSDPLFSAAGVPSMVGIPTVNAPPQQQVTAIQQLLINLMSAQNNGNPVTSAPQPVAAPWGQLQATPSQIPSQPPVPAPAPNADMLQQLLANASQALLHA